MSVHLGLHMSRFAALFQTHQWIWAALVCLTALYGGCVFITMNFASYLLPTSSFLFFDTGQPLWGLLAKAASVMVLFALLGHIAAKLTQHKMKKEK